ncbi:MAG: DNA recombination protein RmuC [Candidatus Caenarcaniphilales bacterium]|nr:DNA recombination protein RmuC [Candidatus Caenarcaniphilales bacterium]
MTDFLNFTNLLLSFNAFAIICLIFWIKNLSNTQNNKDLHVKNFFSNIKNQGIWGEEQLANLLNETLSSSQFDLQCHIEPKSDFIVDAAVKIPTANNNSILLPIDSKLPLEDYMNFLNSNEEINYQNAKKYIKKIESKIKVEAKSIREKYIKPPYTTDFAIIFLPIESLYYLLIQNIAFIEQLRGEYKILIASPSSLSALINSVSLCFKYSQLEGTYQNFYDSIELLTQNFEDLDLTITKSEKKLEDLYKSLTELKTKTKSMKRQMNSFDEKAYT